MATILRFVLIGCLFLQSLLPITIKKESVPNVETGIITSQSPTLENVDYSVPLFSEQVISESLSGEEIQPLSLRVEASPQLIIPGEPVSIKWSIAGWNTKNADQGFSLFIQLPEGVTSKEGVDLSSIPITTNSGSMVFSTNIKMEMPFLIDIFLSKEKEILDATSILISKPGFQVEKGKSSLLTSSDGRVQIEIPSNAIADSLLMDIRTPGPSNQRGYSLSGYPIEVVAVSESSKENFTQFAGDISITVKYDPDKIFDWAEEDLSLFYFNEISGDWWPVETTVNKETHELTAKVDHLTVFDYKANSWQGARTPIVDGAQVSSYTGAATYNTSFWVPPAPGGFQPSISLDYNSQVIDNSTAFTQASWVGMGWSLDTGYIERNMHGTNSTLTDDTFSLLLNGTSTQLLPIETSGTITRYAARNMNYWTIEYDSSTTNWTIYDQSGTVYHFNDQTKTYTTSGCASSLANLNMIWRWSLSSAVDKFGNTLNYTYYKEPKSTSCYSQIAVYPDTISYPNGHYQIKFLRETRTDYQSAWEATASLVLYSKSRLDKIQVQHSSDGTNWTNVRQYDFTYSSGTTNQIYPHFNWTKGGKTATLAGVQELDGSGNALPATSFSYTDLMHVTKVDNNQGGSVTYTYERWHYLDDTNKDIRHIYTSFGDYGNNCYSDYPEDTLWQQQAGYGTVKCEQHYLQIDKRNDIVGMGLREFPQYLIKPGGHYRMVIKVRNIYATTGVEWGFIDGYNQNDVQGSYSGIGTSFVSLEYGGEMAVDFDPNNTKLIIECSNCYVDLVNFALMPQYYRVTQQTVTDSVTGRTSAYTYAYDEPAVNDTAHSESANKSTDTTKFYVPPMRDYRGYAVTMVTNPDGLLNTTWFYQNDILAGSPYRTLTSTKDFYDTFNSLNTTNWTYSHKDTRQTLINLLWDNALSNYNPTTVWDTWVNRAPYSLTNGDMLVTNFTASGATITPSPTATITVTPTPTLTPTPSVLNGNAEYFYDGDGNLVKSIIGDVTTYYPSSNYEKRVEGATETVLKYYFAGSVRIAMRENGVITWLLSDHLGSTIVTADGSGTLLTSLKYTAYGEIRTGSSLTDYQYTGQRNEAEIGLYYYVARFYDPALGRFISADTIVPEPGSSKAYDRFAYVNGNPINFNDPSGHSSWDGSTGDIGTGGSGNSHHDYIMNVIHDENQREMNRQKLQIIVDVASTIIGVFSEPVDWVITATYCINGECSPWVLTGLLPIVPGGLSKHVDDVLDLTKKPPVVIGENMKRVTDYANKIGGQTINDFIPYKEWTLPKNQDWADALVNEGRKILDIGPDFPRRVNLRDQGIKPSSIAYNIERMKFKGYSGYVKIFERFGKWVGGVLGLDW